MVFRLVQNLSKEKFRPVVACVEKGGLVAQKLENSGIPIHFLGRSTKTYRQILEMHKIDIVNSHYSVFGAPITSTLGIPNIHVLHNSFIWISHLRSAQLSWAFQNINHFVAVSSSVKNYSQKRFFIPESKLTVIPNAHDYHTMNPYKEDLRAKVLSELGWSNNSFIFLLTGSFEPRKGHLALLHAFARIAPTYPNAKLICIGAIFYPDYLKECRALVKRLDLDERVRLQDFDIDIDRFYAAADAFVLPSIVEGFSLSTLEAAAHGLPLVLTNTGGAQELLTHYPAGILVKSYIDRPANAKKKEIRDAHRYVSAELVRELGNAMTEICKNRDRWKELARSSFEKILEVYSTRTMVQKYETLFAESV